MDQTHVPCISRWILNDWTTREVLIKYLLRKHYLAREYWFWRWTKKMRSRLSQNSWAEERHTHQTSAHHVWCVVVINDGKTKCTCYEHIKQDYRLETSPYGNDICTRIQQRQLDWEWDTGQSGVGSLGGQRRGLRKGPGAAGSLGEGCVAGMPRAQGSCRMRLKG